MIIIWRVAHYSGGPTGLSAISNCWSGYYGPSNSLKLEVDMQSSRLNFCQFSCSRSKSNTLGLTTGRRGIVPLFRVPESLLSGRGTNLLLHVMTDLCKMLGIKKLNTTAYHPECDGMVEWFNCTPKTSLHKHATTYGNRWDQYYYGMLIAYHNTPHESTGDKPSHMTLRCSYSFCIHLSVMYMHMHEC